MNKTKLIEKNKNNGMLYRLADNSGEVIGQEVDESNRLLYIIKKGDQFDVQYAGDVRIIPVIYPDAVTQNIRVVQSDRVTKLEEKIAQLTAQIEELIKKVKA